MGGHITWGRHLFEIGLQSETAKWSLSGVPHWIQRFCWRAAATLSWTVMRAKRHAGSAHSPLSRARARLIYTAENTTERETTDMAKAPRTTDGGRRGREPGSGQHLVRLTVSRLVGTDCTLARSVHVQRDATLAVQAPHYLRFRYILRPNIKKWRADNITPRVRTTGDVSSRKVLLLIPLNNTPASFSCYFFPKCSAMFWLGAAGRPLSPESYSCTPRTMQTRKLESCVHFEATVHVMLLFAIHSRRPAQITVQCPQ